jgi:ribosomal protein L18E
VKLPWKKNYIDKLVDGQLEKALENAKSPKEILEVMRILERRATIKKGVSRDTVVIVAGNLLGIGMILGFERASVVTSKALGFVLRGRV